MTFSVLYVTAGKALGFGQNFPKISTHWLHADFGQQWGFLRQGCLAGLPCSPVLAVGVPQGRNLWWGMCCCLEKQHQLSSQFYGYSWASPPALSTRVPLLCPTTFPSICSLWFPTLKWLQIDRGTRWLRHCSRRASPRHNSL